MILKMISDETNMNSEFDEHGPMPDETQPEGLDNASRSPFERPTFERAPRFSFGPKKNRFAAESGEGYGNRSEQGGRPRFTREDRVAGGRFANQGEERPYRFEHSRRGNGTMMPIDADLLDYFPNPGAVNSALRAIAGIIRNQRGRGGYQERGGFERQQRGHRGFSERNEFFPREGFETRPPFTRRNRDHNEG